MEFILKNGYFSPISASLRAFCTSDLADVSELDAGSTDELTKLALGLQVRI